MYMYMYMYMYICMYMIMIIYDSGIANIDYCRRKYSRPMQDTIYKYLPPPLIIDAGYATNDSDIYDSDPVYVISFVHCGHAEWLNVPGLLVNVHLDSFNPEEHHFTANS